jgi:sigma-B regulation protein RsbU (phosphoserine phosphatase)
MLGVITVLNKPGGFLQTDLELLETIAGSAAIAIENARLYQVAVEQGRMERELQMARRVQTSLIPEETPKIKGWEFAAQWLPAREVSGDFYDFIALENGNLGLFIADVTDKGMPAALFMAFSRSIVRASLHQSKTLAEGIGLANHLICEDSSQTMPVTLFCAELNPKTGELTYVNAGHNPPLYFAKKAKGPAELTRTGLLLGLDGQAVYQQETITLESGDFVVLYTDGVTDAINSKEEEFGTERLQKVVKASRGKSTQEIVAAVETAIKKFIGEAHQYDDVTIMVVKRM